MIADDVRRLLIASGTDQARVLWHDGAEAPTAPSHHVARHIDSKTAGGMPVAAVNPAEQFGVNAIP